VNPAQRHRLGCSWPVAGLPTGAAGYRVGMHDLNAILDEVYVGEERVSRAEIHRRAVAELAPSALIGALDALPEGEYTHEELTEALSQMVEPVVLPPAGAGPGRPVGGVAGGSGNELSIYDAMDADEVGVGLVAGDVPPQSTPSGWVQGVPAGGLDDQDPLRELGELHRTRHDTLRHGSAHALARHTERLNELEQEYLRRFPQREVDPQRLRSGARTRMAVVRPLEESPEVVRAVADDSTVRGLS